jgi:hypothetical protein
LISTLSNSAGRLTSLYRDSFVFPVAVNGYIFVLK